jgi:hypothetical protein
MTYPVETLQFTLMSGDTNSEQRYVFIVNRDRLFISTTWTFKDELGSTVGPDTATFTDIRQLEKILRLRTDALVNKNFVLDEYVQDILEMQSAR